MQNKQKQLEYERLVLVYSDDLFRYAMWLCRDKSMAEDLVQESCMRAWKSLDKLRETASSKAWLMTILRNELANEYKEPLLLQVIGGLSCEEIASVCNITKSATMTRLFRAKQKLRDILRPEEGPKVRDEM